MLDFYDRNLSPIQFYHFAQESMPIIFFVCLLNFTCVRIVLLFMASMCVSDYTLAFWSVLIMIYYCNLETVCSSTSGSRTM